MTQTVTGKCYVWGDIHSKNIMEGFHSVKALGEGTVLKVGKIQVAREVNIHTDPSRKAAPSQQTREHAASPGCRATQPGAQEVTREEVPPSDKVGPFPLQGTTRMPFRGLDHPPEWDLLS